MLSEAASPDVTRQAATPQGDDAVGSNPVRGSRTSGTPLRLPAIVQHLLADGADAAVARTALIALAAAAAGGVLLRLSGWLGASYGWFTAHGAGVDSWGPMIAAYHYSVGHPGHLYGIFFTQHVKFQYPPSALGLVWALEAIGIRDTSEQIGVLNAVTWVALLMTPLAVYRLSLDWSATRRPQAASWPARRMTALALAASTLVFWPVMMAWTLGQLQTVLNLLFLAALIAWVRNRQGLAGVLIGLICVIKPQLGLFLLWGAVAGAWRFVIGQAAVCAVCFGGSLLAFGLEPHRDYLAVLSYIAQHGETYAFNQSVNGFLNRLAFPDAMLPERGAVWQNGTDFAPFDHVVALATTGSSLTLIAAAGIGAWRHGATALMFCFAALALTMASPVAWDHHYGLLIGVFVILLGCLADQDLAAGRLLPRCGTVFLLCFVASALRLKGDLPGHPIVTDILLSHLFLAALGTLVLLWQQQTVPAAGIPTAATILDRDPL